MGSDVYGLPSQETYLDSQNIHSDSAKIGIFLLSSKYFRDYFKFWPVFGLNSKKSSYFCGRNRETAYARQCSNSFGIALAYSQPCNRYLPDAAVIYTEVYGADGWSTTY